MDIKLIRRLILLSLILIGTLNVNSQTSGDLPAGARSSVSEFILSLQYKSGAAEGAFRKSNGPAYRDGATDMFFVEPYFTHIACMALLNEGKTTAVEKWMNWYISKVRLYVPSDFTYDPIYGSVPITTGREYADPLMMNYFYDANGGAETTCPSSASMPAGTYCTEIDAEDSDPALFFMLAYRYYKAVGSVSWFSQPGVKAKLEGFVNFIYEHLYDPATGLTDAKRAWPMKYTMDNAEVYAGLVAFIGIMNDVYSETSTLAVTRATTMMNSIKGIGSTNADKGIESLKMYPKNGALPTSYNDFKLFGSANCCDGYLDGQRMYDLTPIMWSVLFGIDNNFDSAAANYIRDLINETMPDWNKPGWYMTAAAGGFWDTSIGYFFSMSNNATYKAAGIAQAISALAESFKLDSAGAESFISDAGWLLLNLQAIEGNGIQLYNY